MPFPHQCVGDCLADEPISSNDQYSQRLGIDSNGEASEGFRRVLFKDAL